MRQWSALLRLLVQHGAALQSSPSLLHLALKTLLRGTRDCDDERNVFHEDLGEGSAAGPSGAPLVEAFVCALVEAGYQEAQDVASCASQLLGRMFFVIQEERDEWSDSEGPYEYRLPTVKFDLPAVQCCLRALRAACRPCTAQQAQQLLHEAIDRAVQCGVYISQRELDERCSLTVEDRKRELRCWLAAIRFAVDLGAEANGSWQGLHTLRHALACIAEHLPHRIKWRTNQPWDDLPAIVAFETVSLLVELGARATADDAANNQEPLLWIAMRLSQPDLLRLLLRAGAPAQQVFNGQTALQNLLTSDDMSSDWLLSHFVKLCCDSPQPANLEPLQLAHLWALLLEAGCPPAAPPPQMAGYLARPEMQATCGWVWVLAEGIPWAPQAHFLFPPTFRAAVRALLLVNHRGLRVSSPPSSNIITMPRQRQTGRRRRTALCTPPGDCQHWREVQLPPALVQRVLRLAAASLSAWLPPLPSCRLAEEP